MRYTVGARVRRKHDGLIQTIYDLNVQARVILCNWVDENHKMRRELHNIPVMATDYCPVELVEDDKKKPST